MTGHVCETCAHSGKINGDVNLVSRLICKRSPRQQSCVFERDAIPEPQRPAGSKCGPEGVHYRERGR